MIEEIIKAFTFTPTIEEKENVYIPKVQSTYTPEKVSYNEMHESINEQLKKKYEKI